MSKYGTRHMETQNKELYYYNMYDGKTISKEVFEEIKNLESCEEVIDIWERTKAEIDKGGFTDYQIKNMEWNWKDCYRIELYTVWLMVYVK